MGSRPEHNRLSWTPNTQCNSLEVTSPSRAVTAVDVAHIKHNAASTVHSSDSTRHSPDLIDSKANAHHDHINLLTEMSDFTGQFPPSLQCQWAEWSGAPCGKILRLGNDMHEHLKSAHGVKNEVFCRWVGCPAGVLEASPHSFASNVERHTCGHSGYRLYKCSACAPLATKVSPLLAYATSISRTSIYARRCSHVTCALTVHKGYEPQEAQR